MTNLPFVPATINLGAVTAGEIPAPLVQTFYEADGVTPAWTDSSGWSAQWSQQAGSGSVLTLTATVSDDGVATVTWSASTFNTPGAYMADLWAWNGTNQYAARFRFAVLPAVAIPS